MKLGDVVKIWWQKSNERERSGEQAWQKTTEGQRVSDNVSHCRFEHWSALMLRSHARTDRQTDRSNCGTAIAYTALAWHLVVMCICNDYSYHPMRAPGSTDSEHWSCLCHERNIRLVPSSGRSLLYCHAVSSRIQRHFANWSHAAICAVSTSSSTSYALVTMYLCLCFNQVTIVFSLLQYVYSMR